MLAAAGRVLSRRVQKGGALAFMSTEAVGAVAHVFVAIQANHLGIGTAGTKASQPQFQLLSEQVTAVTAGDHSLPVQSMDVLQIPEQGASIGLGS
jgi:hypothetical protein